MPEIDVPADDTVKIISQPPAGSAFFVDNPSGNPDLLIAHNSQRVRTEGKRIESGDRGEVSNLRGKSLYAKTDGSTAATISVDSQGFDLNIYPRSTLTGERQNRNTGFAFIHDPSTDGSQLPDNEIPDGFDFALKANGGRIKFGFSSGNTPITLSDGEGTTLGLTNTNGVYVAEADTNATVEVWGEA
jgi:hypothetical protein